MSQRDDENRNRLLEIAADLIAITTDDGGTLTERMAAHFAWMYVLSTSDREACAIDLVQAARASFATKQPHLAIAALHAWRETAQAIADGLGEQSAEWLDHSQPVARP